MNASLLPHADVFDTTPLPRVTRRARLTWRLPPLRAYVLVVGVVALILNMWQIGAPSIWFDEAYSIQLAKQPVSVILASPYGWGQEAHMTAYYLLLHYWLRALAHLGIAPSEALVRLPSALAATCAAVVLFLLAYRLTQPTHGRRIIPALATVALFVCAPQALTQAQMTRSYALETLCACLSWYALIRALERGRRRDWLLYTLASSALVYAHLFGVLLVVAQGVYIAALFLRDRREFLPILRAYGVALVGVIALSELVLIDAAMHGGNNSFVPAATPGGVLPLIVTVVGNPVALVACVVLGVVASIASLKRLRWLAPVRTSALFVALAWALVPLMLAYLATQPGHNVHLFYARYLIVTLPGWCLLAGLGVVALPWPPARLVVAVALVAVVAVSLPRTYTGMEVWDVRGAAQWVEARYQPGDGVACLPGYICSVPADYYFSLLNGPARLDKTSPGQYHWHPAYITHVTQATIADYATTHPRLFVITVAGNDAALRAWLDATYTRLATYTTHSMMVTLYQT